MSMPDEHDDDDDNDDNGDLEDGDPDDQDDYHCDQDDDQDDQDLIAGRPQSVNSSFDSHTSHSLGGQGRDSSFNRS